MTVKMKTEGPLFSSMGRSGIATIRKESMNMNVEIAQKAKEMLQTRLSMKPTGVLLTYAEAEKGKASGERGTPYRDTLRVAASALNVIVMDRNAVYGPWLEGTSSRNATTRFKGYFSFRKITEEIERSEIPKYINIYQTRIANALNVGGV